MPETVRLQAGTSDLYEAIQQVTGMPYAEIAARSSVKFVQSLPGCQGEEVEDALRMIKGEVNKVNDSENLAKD